MPKIFLGYFPPPYKLHHEYPLEFDAVPLGRLIAEFPRMMFAFLRNMKRKLMVGVAFVLFVPISNTKCGGSYTIAVLREVHAQIIFMRSCLAVIFLFVEVMVKVSYSLLFILRS